jgi:hypothetical protein
MLNLRSDKTPTIGSKTRISWKLVGRRGRCGDNGSDGNCSNPTVDIFDVPIGEGRRLAGREDVMDAIKVKANAAWGWPGVGGLETLSLTMGLSSVDRGCQTGKELVNARLIGKEEQKTNRLI